MDREMRRSKIVADLICGGIKIRRSIVWIDSVPFRFLKAPSDFSLSVSMFRNNLTGNFGNRELNPLLMANTCVYLSHDSFVSSIYLDDSQIVNGENRKKGFMNVNLFI